MGGTISVYTDPVVADPYAAKCRVAMPLSASRQDRACGIAVTAEYKEVSDNGGINVGLRSCYGGLYGQAGQSWISLGQYPLLSLSLCFVCQARSCLKGHTHSPLD